MLRGNRHRRKGRIRAFRILQGIAAGIAPLQMVEDQTEILPYRGRGRLHCHRDMQDEERIVDEHRDSAGMIAVGVREQDTDPADAGGQIRVLQLLKRIHRAVQEHKLIPTAEKCTVMRICKGRAASEKLQHRGHLPFLHLLQL